MSRNRPTEAESRFWSKTRKRQINNCKFRRQHGIGCYIVDFYCPEKRLVVEIDGDSHYNKKAIEYDKYRSEYIKKLGIEMVRFTNDEVIKNIDGVLGKILELTTPNPSLTRRGTTTPNPSLKKEGN